ncbi:MAG: choice-of-anchor J domain-containing protein, partial [Flavobacteriaceae bacterium]|nr:choice-of-anchor J domain-containing protein [Flavobacteriaceae bacterium]
MIKTTKILSFLGLFIFSCIIYAMNKEFNLKEFLFTSEEVNEEVVIKETTNKVSSKRLFDKAVNSTASNILFTDDFEGTVSKWTFTNDLINEWHIGTATKSKGASSMYITNDAGVSNTYTSKSNISIAESDVITIPLGTSMVNLFYSWRSIGEASFSGSTLYDYGQVWIMPDTYLPVAKKAITVADGGILVHDAMINQGIYKNENREIDVSQFAGKDIKIVFLWRDDSSTEKQPPLSIDDVSLTIPKCVGIKGFKHKQNTSNTITFEWNTLPVGVSIEMYYSSTNVNPNSSTSGVVLNGKNNHTFIGLSPDTLYYVWYRSECANGDKGEWFGPIEVRTNCGTQSLPFQEGFNTSSTSMRCWTIIDVDNDFDPLWEENGWYASKNSPYEGDQSMHFNGGYWVDHNDWLISPEFDFVSGGLYKLVYYYKTNTYSYYSNEFEVVLFNGGINISNPSKVLVPKDSYYVGSYQKKEVYIQGVSGIVNIGWHIDSSDETEIYIDKVSIEKVDCISPEKLQIIGSTTNSVDLKWDDVNSTSWEYWIQPKGGSKPTGSGILTSTNPVTATKDHAG